MSSESDKIVIKEITPKGLLSFGPDTQPIKLGSLNVLIGPNGSGKSNFIDILALLHATPNDLPRFLSKNGGKREWVWKGIKLDCPSINTTIVNKNKVQFSHFIAFSWEAVNIFHEQIRSLTEENSENIIYDGFINQRFYYLSDQKIDLSNSKIDTEQSIISQLKDPDRYLTTDWLSFTYSNIRIYREWEFGRNTIFRQPQRADERNDYLEEDFSNLGLFLNKLRRDPKAKKAILDGLKDLYEEINDYDVIVEGGTVQVFFTENDYTIPATRLSDGTLRYLCLLAILCDPTPPPLICIEEPELGLHPDVLPKLADLMKEASERTQLIITTHSDILVDAMTDHPESILVCEKHDGQTQMNRLDPEELKEWLTKYRLGELWTRGHIGGTRW